MATRRTDMKGIFLSAALLMPLVAGANCGSAFCAVNTDWDAQGAWTEPGARLDLRYEYIRQDQPMAGRKRVAVGEFPRDHDELVTINHNLLASLDYTLSQDWAVNLLLPMVQREHRHVDTVAVELETWNFTELGDIRVMARRRLATLEDSRPSVGTLGVNFGLKLPTGRSDVMNAAGELAEPGLQPGTGSTDLLAGLYYSRLLPLRSLSWFVQSLVQAPVHTRSGYHPGSRVSLDAGMRYGMGDSLGLLLQANALVRGRDGGGLAEREDTGGSFLFISPGVSYAVSRSLQAYGFVQLPIYQFVSGVQLVARYAVSLGVSGRF